MLNAEGAVRYYALIERRLAGEPIQYITGQTEFYGLPFSVDCSVLIPRPETEHLVEKALSLAGSFPQPRIVDVGTGSGAIAVALAHKLPAASITAIDLSAQALAVARANAQQNAVNNRIRFLQGDLLAPVAGEDLSHRCLQPALCCRGRPRLARRRGPRLRAGTRALCRQRWTRRLPSPHSPAPLLLFLAALSLLKSAPASTPLSPHYSSRHSFDPRRFHRELQGIQRVVSAAPLMRTAALHPNRMITYCIEYSGRKLVHALIQRLRRTRCTISARSLQLHPPRSRRH